MTTESIANKNLDTARIFMRLAKCLRDNKKESITPSELDVMAGILVERDRKK